MDDAIEAIARWLVEQKSEIKLSEQVTVREADTAEGPRTSVAIDHRLSCPLPGHEGWRITTKRTMLPRGHFSSRVAHVHKTADHDRGRTIYCQDRAVDDQVVAAITYHLDERASWPLFITMIGFRVDFADIVELRRRTLEGAFLLKQYVHVISEKVGRGANVHMELPPQESERYTRDFGFVKAAKLKGLRATGTHMRQGPLGQSSGIGT